MLTLEPTDHALFAGVLFSAHVEECQAASAQTQGDVCPGDASRGIRGDSLARPQHDGS